MTIGTFAARIGRDGTVHDPGGLQLLSQVVDPTAIAFDGTNYLVAYSKAGNNWVYNIYAKRIARTGQVLDSADGIAITTDAVRSSVSVSLAYVAGEYVAGWVSSPAIGVYSGIFGARIGVDGTVRSPGSYGVRMGGQKASFYPAIASSQSGGLLIWLNQFNGPNEVEGLCISPFGP
jgi:hypothetical protein